MNLEDVFGIKGMSEASSKALIKLLEVLQIGIGGTFAPMMGYFKRVADAKGEVHADRILRRGNIKTEKLLLQDQHELDQLRRSLAMPQLPAAVGGEPQLPAPAPEEKIIDAEWIEVDLSDLTANRSLAQRARSRWEYQEAKRQSNVEHVAAYAISELPADEAVSDEPVDLDWIARFFDAVKDVSQEDMQRFWAKVLAGEVARPGRFSLRTLDVLRSLRQSEALLLDRVAPFAFDGGHLVDEGGMFFRASGCTYEDILRLEECGLLQRNMAWFIASGTPGKFLAGFGFLDKWVTLAGSDPNFRWTLAAFCLTSAARELRSLKPHKADGKMLDELSVEAKKRGLVLTLAGR